MPFAGVAHLVERDLAKVEVASSSLVARSKTPPYRVVFFRVRLGAHRRVSRLPAATAADSRDTSSKAPRFIRHRRRFGAFLVARGRVIEREWGNPSKVPPSHSPFLAVSGKTRCLDLREARQIKR